MILAVLIFCFFVTIDYEIKESAAYERKIYCIGSTEYQNDGKCTGSHYEWLKVATNFSEYFVSYSDIWILPGIYNLDGHVPIINTVNISLNGISNDEVAATINCTNGDSFMSIYNSSLFEIRNITFINCGTSLIKVYNVSLPATTSAALLLYNVLSIVITDVVFRNSQGHGIIAYNVTGMFTLDRVKITQDRTVITPHTTGGIILVFIDSEVRISKKQSVLIQNSQITDIFTLPDTSYKPKKTQPHDYTESIAIGIALHQGNYSVNVQVKRSNITNLTSYKGSHIFISHRSYARNTVNFTNVSFINNTNRHQDFSMFRVGVINTGMTKILSLTLVVRSCTFYHNAMVFWQPTKQYWILMVKLTIVLSDFAYNHGIRSSPMLSTWSLRFTNLLQVTIKQCSFYSNYQFNIGFNKVKKLIISGHNIFRNNTARQYLIIAIDSYPIFKGYNEFSNNTANAILSLYQYVMIEEGTVINMVDNKVFSNVHQGRISIKDQKHWSLLHFGTRHTLFPCPFQFIATSQAFGIYRKLINVNISILNNSNYYCAVYGTQLNSCYWQNGTAFNSFGTKNEHSITPGEVNKNALHYDGNLQSLISREGAILCTCKTNAEIDCFNDHITPAYPGQTITINVTLLPPHHQTAVYIDSSKVLNNSISPPCEFPHSSVYLVSNKCTPLAYKIVSKFTNACSVYLKTMATSEPETLFIYYLKLKECPLGFQHINGSCICDPLLLDVFPELMCDITAQTITRPMSSWIGTAGVNKSVLFVEYCIAYFCLTKSNELQLDFPDYQCVNNRVGVMCGHCPAGFDSVFGSLKCKRCSNVWLFLIPVFLLAGLLLVASLFTMNLTVVDGKINGFLFYANIMAGNNYNIFPTRNALFGLMSMCSLDLGIETCFYHGMTEYDKTWLQFIFPLYLLLIVGVIVTASRYSRFVEQRTRKRVIPVIATIVLLSYNKLLMAATKVLFSYKTVYRLNDNSKQVIWMWDSSVPLISIKFLLLFMAALVIFLFVLVPLNALLLFTKCFYRFKFVSKYLKPFLDAYQAPFKHNCCYFLGLEFIIRCILFTFGNRIVDNYPTLAAHIFITGAFIIYLCTFQPFKDNSKNILYVSYVCNLGSVVTLVTFTNFKVTNFYSIFFNLLLFTAVVEFVGSIVYCLYAKHLEKFLIKWLPKGWIKNCISLSHPMQSRLVSRYEKFQEELLELN